MSDEKPGDKPDDVKKESDVVKRDDYNKIVETHNSIKAEKEKLEKEMKEMKEKIEKKNVEEEQKNAWEKEKEEMKQQIEEIKKKKKGSKAQETDKPKEEKQISEDKVKEQINKVLPTEGMRDPSIMTPFERYGYFKNPATRRTSSQLLGRALSLHAGAQKSGLNTSPYAKKSNDDVVVADIKKSLT